MTIQLPDRLDNWSRWARTYGIPQGRCASIEGRYVAPKLTDESAEERTAKHAQEPIDYQDAELVERAISGIEQRSERVFVHHWYVKRSPVKRLCKLFQIRAHLLGVFHDRCIADLGQSLRRVEYADSLARSRKVLYNRHQIIELPSLDELLPMAAAASLR